MCSFHGASPTRSTQSSQLIWLDGRWRSQGSSWRRSRGDSRPFLRETRRSWQTRPSRTLCRVISTFSWNPNESGRWWCQELARNMTSVKFSEIISKKEFGGYSCLIFLIFNARLDFFTESVMALLLELHLKFKNQESTKNGKRRAWSGGVTLFFLLSFFTHWPKSIFLKSQIKNYIFSWVKFRQQIILKFNKTRRNVKKNKSYWNFF